MYAKRLSDIVISALLILVTFPIMALVAILIRIESLFGMLMTSFVVVVINSLILITLRRIAKVLLSNVPFAQEKEIKRCFAFHEIILNRRWYYIPDPRGPPFPLYLP